MAACRPHPALLTAMLAAVLARPGGPVARGDDLEHAPRVETVTLERLETAASWPRRALAAIRLERYGGEACLARLRTLAHDPAWQVRCFTIETLGRRGETLAPEILAAEDDPRVLRAALRWRHPVDAARLDRGVRALAQSTSLADRLLAAELAAASGDESLRTLADELAKKVILRMNRAQGGALSPRLAVLTGQPDPGRAYRWRRWLREVGRSFHVRPALFERAGAPTRIAALEPERFAALVDYIEALGSRRVDLAICLDTTASMSGELAAAQGGIDALVAFVDDVVSDFRVGLVTYRDRRTRSRPQAWDFTGDLDELRRRLWSLVAAGGGDSREDVHAGLRIAYTGLSWAPDRTRVLVLIGDAPPHHGFGEACVDLARRGQMAACTTHVIEAAGKPVERFAAIADAGGGRCVPLDDDGLLIPEIAGLTLGDMFAEEMREFFHAWRRLCR